MDDIVEQVKARNRIEDVIAEELPLGGRGRYLRAREHDSLIVDTHTQSYHWNARSEHGDVLNWVQNRKRCDFKGAVEMLCQRAGMEAPHWGGGDAQVRLAGRLLLDVLDLGAAVFERWLWKAGDSPALAYARGRGWTDETIKAARLGYCGSGSQAEREDLLGELRMHQVDLESPGTVALVGFRGDVRGWAKAHGIEVKDISEDWIRGNGVPGMFGRDCLVYPHVMGGRVRYLSARGIGEKRHWNMPACIMARQMYLNWEWSPRGEIVAIVEGQADAVSLGQWGIGALALAGTNLAQGAPLRTLVEGCDLICLGMDDDEGGKKSIEKQAEFLGVGLEAMARVIHWGRIELEDLTPRLEEPIDPSLEGRGENDEQVKDANDLLKAWARAGVTAERQREMMRETLETAKTYLEEEAERAGRLRGAKREEAQRRVMTLTVGVNKVTLAQFRQRLAEAMGVSLREFNAMHKATVITEQADEEDEEREAEVVETLGAAIGWKKGEKGWLLEYLYDHEEDTGRLAYKNPEGKVGTIGEKGIIIDKVRYIPKRVTTFVRDGAVIFPAAVGELMATQELVNMVEDFITRHYLLPEGHLSRLIAYYVLLTWMFDAFNAIPYLRAMGEPGAGKSELMRRVGILCYRLISASGANTASTFFRTTEIYRGTVFIDEADLHDGGDMANDLVKFLNLGAMRGNPIARMEKTTDADGNELYEPTTFSTFCPKLIAMRKDFKDSAVGSRSITIPLMERSPMELSAAGVRLSLDNAARKEAEKIRNLLLRWRLEHWQPEIEVAEDLMDMNISARLNQVTMPLKALAKDDPNLMAEIVRFLRDYYAEMVLDRSMTLAARIVEAMWKVWNNEDLRRMHLYKSPGGEFGLFIGGVTSVANDIIDDMNSTGGEGAENGGGEEGGENKKGKDALTTRGVGSLLRKTLQLRTSARTKKGYAVMWDGLKMLALGKQYGVLPSGNGGAEDGEENLTPDLFPEREEEIDAQTKFDV